MVWKEQLLLYTRREALSRPASYESGSELGSEGITEPRVTLFLLSGPHTSLTAVLCGL